MLKKTRPKERGLKTHKGSNIRELGKYLHFYKILKKRHRPLFIYQINFGKTLTFLKKEYLSIIYARQYNFLWTLF